MTTLSEFNGPGFAQSRTRGFNNLLGKCFGIRHNEGMPNQPPRVFISFDFDHDEPLRNLLVGQGKHSDTPFSIADWSVKEPFTGDWKAKVRARISRTEQVIVICGEHTHTATGVAAELQIARDERKPYFLLGGYSNKPCKAPVTAMPGDKIYQWTWENLKLLMMGGR